METRNKTGEVKTFARESQSLFFSIHFHLLCWPTLGSQPRHVVLLPYLGNKSNFSEVWCLSSSAFPSSYYLHLPLMWLRGNGRKANHGVILITKIMASQRRRPCDQWEMSQFERNRKFCGTSAHGDNILGVISSILKRKTDVSVPEGKWSSS